MKTDFVRTSSPEMRALTQFLRWVLFERDSGTLDEKETLDWDLVQRLVIQHGLAGHFRYNLNPLRDLLPPSVLEYLEQQGRAQAARNLRQTHQLTRVMTAMSGEGIPGIPFKGPVLSQRLWGGVSRRTYVDLDVLILPDHRIEAIEILDSLGFELQSDYARLPDRQLERLPYTACTLVHRNGVTLDLKWRLFVEPHLPRWDLERLQEHSTTVGIKGRHISCLGWLDCWKVISLHHAQHRWERLGWILDLAQFLRLRPFEEAEKILVWAAKKGLKRRVEVGFWLAHRLFDAPVRGSVEQTVLNSDLALISSRVFRPLSGREIEGGVEELSLLETIKDDYYLSDPGHMKTFFQLLLWRIFRPWDVDFRNTPYSRWIPGLASAGRVWRLLKKYVWPRDENP